MVRVLRRQKSLRKALLRRATIQVDHPIPGADYSSKPERISMAAIIAESEMNNAKLHAAAARI